MRCMRATFQIYRQIRLGGDNYASVLITPRSFQNNGIIGLLLLIASSIIFKEISLNDRLESFFSIFLMLENKKTKGDTNIYDLHAFLWIFLMNESN